MLNSSEFLFNAAKNPAIAGFEIHCLCFFSGFRAVLPKLFQNFIVKLDFIFRYFLLSDQL